MPSKTSATSFEQDQLTASAATALQCVDAAEELAPQLVEAWVKTSNGAAVQVVAEQGKGAARKAARRGLNVLKSRGVQIPRSEHVQTLGSVSSTAVRSESQEAWLLPPDNAGAVGIVLAERLSSGKYSSVFCFLRASQQLLKVQSGQVSHSKLKESMARSLTGSGYSAVPVPWAWAQHRIALCRRWHAANGVTEPMGLLAAAKLLKDDGAESVPHPFDEEGLELGSDDAVKLAKESGQLHQWPEFRSWLPSQNSLQELLAKVGSRLDPDSLSDPEKVNPILKEEVLAATDRFFTPERREALARNLQDSALSVLARQGEQDALRVSAVINVIRGAGLITNPPSEVAFLTAFFDKGIAVLASQQGGKLKIPMPRPTATSDANQETSEPIPAEKEMAAASEEQSVDAD